jgi:hypothetical protein
MRPEQRLRNTASADRPGVSGPNSKRLIVWPVVNVEHWLIDNPMPRQVLVAPTGAALLPDVPNWAWHEYGTRVGFWRFLDAFNAHGIRPTLSVNGSVCIDYPGLAAAARDAGWQFMGHGFVQVPTQKVADERDMIRRSADTIAAFTGRTPRGWLGPGLTETLASPDLLAEAGIRWIADWVVDDLPARLVTAHGEVLTMPCSVEHNDVPMMMVQHHPAVESARRVQAAEDRPSAEAAACGGAKVPSFAVHPYIIGVPHRIAMLEELLASLAARDDVVFLPGDDIAA